MAVVVDSNVILDIVCDDPVWGDWSEKQVLHFQSAGLVVNPMIYAELCAGARDAPEVDNILLQLGLDFQELPREALFLAAQAFVKYRRQGGTKEAPLPDFFIGAHAEVLGIPLLTRARGRYQTYFPSVTLLLP